MRYTVTAYVNVTEDSAGRPTGMLDGYKPGDKLAVVTDAHGKPITFEFEAESEHSAAEAVFAVGNRMSVERAGGGLWPSDVRSMSVGDVLKLPGKPGDSVAWLAVASFGWDLIEVPTNFVELAGTNATSRSA
jgi:hypothetical protein